MSQFPFNTLQLYRELVGEKLNNYKNGQKRKIVKKNSCHKRLQILKSSKKI